MKKKTKAFTDEILRTKFKVLYENMKVIRDTHVTMTVDGAQKTDYEGTARAMQMKARLTLEFVDELDKNVNEEEVLKKLSFGSVKKNVADKK